MDQVLLINEDYIYQNTQVNTSVEATKIYPFIRLAQDKWIEPILGTNLMAKIKTDGSSIAGNYLTLRDTYLRPALCWFALQEMLPSLNFKIDNGSIAQHNSENTQAVGMTEMNAVIDGAKSNARYYAERMRDYLCHNSSLFPEFSTNTGANISPTQKQLNSFEVSGNNHSMHRNSQPNYKRFLP
jgi:hypothetical protein